MLDYADCVAINKMDRKGALDAVRDVRKQVQRNREAFGTSPEDMPVYGCMASKFADPGVTALYQGVLNAFVDKGFRRPGLQHRCGGNTGLRARPNHRAAGPRALPVGNFRHRARLPRDH